MALLLGSGSQRKLADAQGRGSKPARWSIGAIGSRYNHASGRSGIRLDSVRWLSVSGRPEITRQSSAIPTASRSLISGVTPPSCIFRRRSMAEARIPISAMCISWWQLLLRIPGMYKMPPRHCRIGYLAFRHDGDWNGSCGICPRGDHRQRVCPPAMRTAPHRRSPLSCARLVLHRPFRNARSHRASRRASAWWERC